MTLVQSEPKAIKIWTTDVKAVYLWENKVRPTGYPTESIIIKIKANSNWVLKIPVSWINTNWWSAATYSWKVSYDWWAETTYSWTWSQTPITIATGLSANSEHTVTIKPTTESYGWARAFSFYASWIQSLLQEIIYDGSYMWYGVSATDTWDYFRYNQYNNCSSLIESPDEFIADTVTQIWQYFRGSQFYQCTSLKIVWVECLPSSVTSIKQSFRTSQYQNCTKVEEIKWWIDLNIWAWYYRNSQFDSCYTNKTVKVLSDVWYASYSGATLSNQFITSVSVPNAYLTNFKNSNIYPRVNITDSKFVWY